VKKVLHTILVEETMKINISNDINYYLEAVSILNSYNNKNSYYEDLKEALVQKYNIPYEKLEKMLEGISDVYNYVVNSVKIPKDKLDFYFTAENPEIPTLCELLMLPLIYDNDEINIKNIFKQNEDEKLENVIKLLFYAFDYDVEIDNFTYVDYINHINNLDVDNDMKYKYVLMCCNINDYFSQIMRYVDETVALLKEKTDDLQCIADEFEKITKLDIEKYGDNFFTKYEIQIDISNDVIIKPSIMAPNYLMMKPYGIYEDKSLHINMGVCVKTINELKKEYFISDEKTISILKAMGDKSKFDILKSIKEKEMYGAEIAKMLNLTTATVSHHMSNLYNLSLVNIITNNNKVNYTLNKESIRELISILERIFLK